MMTIENDKREFLRSRERLLKPASNDAEIFSEINRQSPVDSQRIDSALEDVETKVLIYQNPTREENSPRILLEAAQTASGEIVKTLVQHLESDNRCGGIAIASDNVARKSLTKDTDLKLMESHHASRSVIEEIKQAGPYHSALVLDDSPQSPAQHILHSAKSTYGAKYLYYFSLGLFSKQARTIWPEHGGSYDPEAMSAFYSSVVPATFEEFGGTPDINISTYEKTLEAMINTATNNSEHEFALIIGTHPRMRGIETFPEPPANMPRNLLLTTSDEKISYEEAVYASDVILCNPLSTEVVLAAYRGRTAAIISYSGPHQFGEITKNIFGDKGVEMIRKSGRADIISQPEDITSILMRHEPHHPLSKPGTDSAEQIKEILLRE